jgi:hypothetical protein
MPKLARRLKVEGTSAGKGGEGLAGTKEMSDASEWVVHWGDAVLGLQEPLP